MFSITEAHREYQILLELHRADPDDDYIWEQYVAARRHLNKLWEIHCLNKSLAGSGPVDQTAS